MLRFSKCRRWTWVRTCRRSWCTPRQSWTARRCTSLAQRRDAIGRVVRLAWHTSHNRGLTRDTAMYAVETSPTTAVTSVCWTTTSKARRTSLCRVRPRRRDTNSVQRHLARRRHCRVHRRHRQHVSLLHFQPPVSLVLCVKKAKYVKKIMFQQAINR